MSTGPKSRESEIKHDSDRNTNHIQSSSSSPINNAGAEAAQTSGEEFAIACPPKISMWKKVIQKLRSTGQISKGPKGKAADTTPTTTQPSSPATTQDDSLIHWINADMLHIAKEAQNLQEYNNKLVSELEKLRGHYEQMKIKSRPELEEFRKYLMKVKLTIPKYKIGGGKKNVHDKKWGFISETQQSMCEDASVKMPELHKRDVFETSMEFKDFEARFMELEYHVKLCLLCFSIFPQDAIIKKRLVLQWWVIEGYATTKKDADDYFKELLKKGFIEPVNNNRSRSVGSCRVRPFHHSVLVALAERAKLFNFEPKSGNPTQNFSGTFQACLMGKGLISYEDFMKQYNDSMKQNEQGRGDLAKDSMKQNEQGRGDPDKVIKDRIKELEKLHLLINVDEHILEFVDEWFSTMSNLNILYLGRWKASAVHHIEVEDSKFLNKVGNMKYVKFLSLQGVSNIISLPRSMKQLTNLDILDLRACSNLESIPDEIGCLKMLTHLDMSECYLLPDMPKRLSELMKLKVLKGFVISQNDSEDKCTLADLRNMAELEKLCIYTNREYFPDKEHVARLEELMKLTKLTITWGVNRKKKSNDSASEQGKKPPPPSTGEHKLPPNLKKLDLKCFPWPGAPDWLKLEQLKERELEKLYIRGGKFSDLGQFRGSDEAKEDEKKWTVEVLRLKYLGGIQMEWRQLRVLFPKLKYLEKVSCPNLTLFPCDAKGVWIKPQ